MAEVFKIPSESSESEYNDCLEKAVLVLQNDGIIAMPSDTIYGLFSLLKPHLINKVHELKQREKSHPFLAVIPSGFLLEHLVNEHKLLPEAKKEINMLWPGKNTLVLPKKPVLEYPPGNSIALRMPARDGNPFFYDVLNRLNEPLIAPSLNVHGQKPLDQVDEIMDVFGNRIQAVFFNPDYKPGKPSTIIDMTVSPFKVLR